MDKLVLTGRCIHEGVAEAEVLVSGQAFAFSHGMDPTTGRVCDPLHDWLGQNIRGKILVFPYGKGSSTGGLWILEMTRLGNAPAGVINLTTEPIIAAGFIMTAMLYDVCVPIMDSLSQNPVECLKTGDFVHMDARQGIVEIRR